MRARLGIGVARSWLRGLDAGGGEREFIPLCLQAVPLREEGKAHMRAVLELRRFRDTPPLVGGRCRGRLYPHPALQGVQLPDSHPQRCGDSDTGGDVAWALGANRGHQLCRYPPVSLPAQRGHHRSGARLRRAHGEAADVARPGPRRVLPPLDLAGRLAGARLLDGTARGRWRRAPRASLLRGGWTVGNRCIRCGEASCRAVPFPMPDGAAPTTRAPRRPRGGDCRCPPQRMLGCPARCKRHRPVRVGVAATGRCQAAPARGREPREVSEVRRDVRDAGGQEARNVRRQSLGSAHTAAADAEATKRECGAPAAPRQGEHLQQSACARARPR
mmetsp:Transcript_113788/g.363056  ORF Transcript_113788/g.363056 Transcript_113788/m.363056 type:complete len:331 (+) Transcript_113788:409-1401(+)